MADRPDLTSNLAVALARLRDQTDAVPALRDLPDVVHRVERARRIRRRRQAGAVATAAAGVLAVVAVLNVAGPLAGSRNRSVPAGPTGQVTSGVLLRAADLGDGWSVGADPGDSAPAYEAAQPGCQDAVQGSGVVLLSRQGTGVAQVYRAATPDVVPLAVREQAITLDDAGAYAISQQLKHNRGCRPIGQGATVLAENNTTLLIAAEGTDTSNGVTEVLGYALRGTTWISLQLRAGHGLVPLPGQAQWALDVLGRAVERATGHAADLPPLTDEARSLAARYRPPSPQLIAYVKALPYDSWSPELASASPYPPLTTAQATGTPSLAAVPPYLVTAVDVVRSSNGAWRIASSAVRTGATTVQLPASDFPKVAARTVHGTGGVVTYRGAARGVTWTLRETLVRVSAAEGKAMSGDLQLLAEGGNQTNSSYGAMTNEFSNGVVWVNWVPRRQGVLVGWGIVDAGVVQVELIPDRPTAERFNDADVQFVITLALTGRTLAGQKPS